MRRKQLSGDKTREQVRRERRLAELKADFSDPRHGTITGYGLGCRCRKCETARRNMNLPRERRVSA